MSLPYWFVRLFYERNAHGNWYYSSELIFVDDHPFLRHGDATDG